MGAVSTSARLQRRVLGASTLGMADMLVTGDIGGLEHRQHRRPYIVQTHRPSGNRRDTDRDRYRERERERLSLS
eukprot:9398191-Alexandrium_andersonii.AAC.1